MFETIIASSFGGTTRAYLLFDVRLTSCSVNSSRVPEGAFRLITNCPGSVRGKYATPDQRIEGKAQ